MNDDSRMLVQKARNGDMDAFAAVFEGLRPDVFRVACRLVGEGDANDVVMDAFLKAWQAMPRFSARSSVKTWLYRITYNCAVDLIRERRHRKETVLSDLEGEDSAGIEIADERQLRPDETAASTETAGLVASALAVLPDEHRTALVLRYSDGLSYSEIAAATGVSIGTVMSRLFNGKRKLRKAFEMGTAR